VPAVVGVHVPAESTQYHVPPAVQFGSAVVSVIVWLALVHVEFALSVVVHADQSILNVLWTVPLTFPEASVARIVTRQVSTVVLSLRQSFPVPTVMVADVPLLHVRVDHVFVVDHIVPL
jgi:hypothetical protein